jgi:hypothetical protein
MMSRAGLEPAWNSEKLQIIDAERPQLDADLVNTFISCNTTSQPR